MSLPETHKILTGQIILDGPERFITKETDRAVRNLTFPDTLFLTALS
jgi:hypothetical protein